MKKYDPLDDLIDIQRWRGSKRVPTEEWNDEENREDSSTEQGWPAYALPTKSTIRKLKSKMVDYQPGPVKTYTQEEIEEYERVRSQELRNRDG